VEGYDWASGIYQGRVPTRATVDVAMGYRITPFLSVQGTVTNLLDQRRYHIFGGSVIGRRALIGMTARP
jgi:outer membrane cobalamin receptor